MKKKIFIRLFLLFLIQITHAQQFDGGNGDGHDIENVNNTTLVNTNLMVLFKGGVGDGQDVDNYFNTTLSSLNLTVLYKGGNGDGHDVENLLNTNLGNLDFSMVFKGGNGDGHDIENILNTTLLNTNLMVLYSGGVGDGHDIASLLNTNLGNFDFSVLFKGGHGDGHDIANLSNLTLSLEVIEELVNLDIRLYPNPASHLVTIKANQGNIITSVEIFNVAGQKINTQLSNNNTINVSNLSDGMYLLKIVSKNGSVSKKLMVKK